MRSLRKLGTWSKGFDTDTERRALAWLPLSVRRSLIARTEAAKERFARLPRWSGSVGALTFVGLFTIYGLVLGGHMPAIANTVTAELGLAVKNVQISGQKEIRSREVFAALGVRKGASLLTLDADQARKRLNRIPWVARASVRKLYPDTLQVALEEREPFALWQRGKLVSLIDRSGNVITDEVPTKFAGLPLLVGHGAQNRASTMVDMLAKYPSVGARVRAAVLISNRRWNLVLENGITVRLPETGSEDAVAELARLDREKSLLSRDIEAVDMRLEDRLVIRLTEAARSRRNARLKKLKAAKKKAADT